MGGDTNLTRLSPYERINNINPLNQPEDDATVQRDNTEPIYLDHFVRCSVRFPKITGSTADLETEFKKMLAKLWTKLDEYVRTYLVPWSEDSLDEPLTKPENLPPKMNDLRKYVYQLRLVKNAPIYAKIRFNCISDPLAEIEELRQWWFFDSGFGIYPMSVQCEDIKDVGWLLYSIRGMSEKKLGEAISDLIKEQVGLRWKMISTGYGEKLDEEDKVFAMHVQASEERCRVINKKLTTLLGHNYNPELPLGIRVRFVPLYDRLRSTVVKNKVLKLISRQHAFVGQHGIKIKESNELLSLDDNLSPEYPTARELIMKIKSKAKPDLCLFHAVETKWNNQRKQCLYFIPQFAEEAAMMVDNLLPYLKATIGKWVEQIFTPSAREIN